MTSGCLDHSAIWSRTKIWRRKRSSVVWASAIRSGRVAVDILAFLRVCGARCEGGASPARRESVEYFVQAGELFRQLIGPKPTHVDPEALQRGRLEPPAGDSPGGVAFLAPAVHEDLLPIGVNEPDLLHTGLPVQRALVLQVVATVGWRQHLHD